MWFASKVQHYVGRSYCMNDTLFVSINCRPNIHY